MWCISQSILQYRAVVGRSGYILIKFATVFIPDISAFFVLQSADSIVTGMMIALVVLAWKFQHDTYILDAIN